jgi:hypothetical protein
MHRPLLVACVCCLICRAGLTQQRGSSAIPDAPSATQQSQTGPEATNALQSGVAMFLTLQKKSVVFPVITRNDSGAPAVNYSGLLGPLAGEALANTYYPPGSRGVGSTLIRYSTDVGWRFGGYLLRQYWPLINRKLQLAPE